MVKQGLFNILLLLVSPLPEMTELNIQIEVTRLVSRIERKNHTGLDFSYRICVIFDCFVCSCSVTFQFVICLHPLYFPSAHAK